MEAFGTQVASTASQLSRVAAAEDTCRERRSQCENEESRKSGRGCLELHRVVEEAGLRGRQAQERVDLAIGIDSFRHSKTMTETMGSYLVLLVPYSVRSPSPDQIRIRHLLYEDTRARGQPRSGVFLQDEPA